MAVHATEVSLEVVRTMFRYAGARSLYAGNIVDRCCARGRRVRARDRQRGRLRGARPGAPGHAGHRAADLSMRRDIEFPSGGDTVRGWLYTPDSGTGRARHRHGRRLVLRQGARPAPLRRGVRGGRLRGDPLRLPQLGSSDGARRQHIDRGCRSRTTRTRSRFARRSRRSTRTASASGGSPTAAATRSSSARPIPG